jgi:predicted small secreted protein
MKMRALCIGVAIAAAALILSGCSHRIGVGSDVPRDQLVVVKVGKFGGAPLCVVGVDGKRLFWRPSRTETLLLAPGQHELEIKLVYTRGTANVYSDDSAFLAFLGEAGHQYRIMGEGNGFFATEYRVWIEDEASK